MKKDDKIRMFTLAHITMCEEHTPFLVVKRNSQCSLVTFLQSCSPQPC